MENTYRRFLNKIESRMLQFGIQPRHQEVLLACSGGLDSTVLLHVLHACKFRIQVAHVNYSLRGEESNQNHQFIQDLCQELDIPFHFIKVNTKNLLQSNEKNLQNLAREIRYAWFEELSQTLQISFVATAHHADDQAETLLYNFIKGSGLKGLRGIASQKEKLIRPLLECSRAELASISETQNWEYSADSSNDLLHYSRNRIRHEIMPKLEAINPAVTETLAAQSNIYRDLNLLMEWTVNQELQKIIISESKGNITIDTLALITIPGFSVILYEFLKKYGFNNEQVRQVVAAVNEKHTGLLLNSPDHKLLVDRATILISNKNTSQVTEPIYWAADQKEIIIQNKIKLEKSMSVNQDLPGANYISIHSDTGNKTMIIRNWKPGDHFYPDGMQGRKKLSDFFIDKKLNRFQKEEIRLLVNEEDQIIWVIGYRADRRFTNNEKTSMKVTLTIL